MALFIRLAVAAFALLLGGCGAHSPGGASTAAPRLTTPADLTAPAPLAETPLRRAREAGDSARLVRTQRAGRFESAAPSSPARPQVRAAIDAMPGGLRTTPAEAPPGAESLAVQWRTIEAPGVGAVLVAVARPAGDGPFPAVIVLHGTHGFALEYVQLAKDLSRRGVLAAAACWFAPGSGPGLRFVSPATCPAETPSLSPHLSPQSAQTIDMLVRAIRELPDVKSDRVALFGHSRGAGTAWNYVLRDGDAQAVVLNSAGYPDEIVQRAAEFDTPALILHGDADGPGYGGSTMTDVRRARAFESALRRAGKSVEAVYYRGGRHNGLFSDPSQYDDELRRMEIFLHRHLHR